MIRTLLLAMLVSGAAPALAVTAILPGGPAAGETAAGDVRVPVRQSPAAPAGDPAADPAEIAAAIAGLLIVCIAFAAGRAPRSVSA